MITQLEIVKNIINGSIIGITGIFIWFMQILRDVTF